MDDVKLSDINDELRSALDALSVALNRPTGRHVSFNGVELRDYLTLGNEFDRLFLRMLDVGEAMARKILVDSAQMS